MTIGIAVEPRPGERIDQLLKRFRRAVAESGVFHDVNRTRWHVPASERRRIKAKAAKRREVKAAQRLARKHHRQQAAARQRSIR